MPYPCITSMKSGMSDFSVLIRASLHIAACPICWVSLCKGGCISPWLFFVEATCIIHWSSLWNSGGWISHFWFSLKVPCLFPGSSIWNGWAGLCFLGPRLRYLAFLMGHIYELQEGRFLPPWSLLKAPFLIQWSSLWNRGLLPPSWFIYTAPLLIHESTLWNLWGSDFAFFVLTFLSKASRVFNESLVWNPGVGFRLLGGYIFP